MFASAQVKQPNSGPGPDIFWFIPIAGLWLFGFAVLFLMEPLYALYGLMLALIAAPLRKSAPGPAKFAIAAMPALLATFALLSSLVLAADLYKRMTAEPLPEGVSRETNGHQFGFHGWPQQRPLYEMAIIELFGQKYEPRSRIPYPSQIDPTQFSYVSGDVLIKSFVWERSRAINAAMGCDARCEMLLKNPNVASVTVEPDRSIFWEGPRAILPGVRPIAMTYRVRDNERCDAYWHGKVPTPKATLSSLGGAVRAFRHKAEVTSWCLIGSLAQQSEYDHSFTGDEFWAQ